jgi:protoheme IX farnesyltransferase
MMRRTASRPLPAGRLPSGEALAFGVVVSLIGLFDLALFVNPLTALVAGSTLIAYVFAYTPLKTRTWWSTSVGAIPGAAPPLIGWAAARGTLDAGAAALFAIQFIWQLPHFYAIAWMYREDYARAGFKMLSVLDPEGTRTRRQIMAWAALLLPVSLLPVVVGANGWIYAGGAILLGTGFLVLALGMRKRNEVSSARRVFLGSILYLPLLFGLMVLDTLLA